MTKYTKRDTRMSAMSAQDQRDAAADKHAREELIALIILGTITFFIGGAMAVLI